MEGGGGIVTDDINRGERKAILKLRREAPTEGQHKKKLKNTG